MNPIPKPQIKTLFVDIGGVLLTNGWDHPTRKLAAKTFDIDDETMEARHRLTFDTFEQGKITLEEYLNRIIFYEKRSFSLGDFEKFMYDQSKPYPEMIELIRNLRKKYQLKIVIVSNEGRELNEYRIKKFKLDDFSDCFISSSFVHMRKPDGDIYQLGLDLCQTPPNQIIYIDDRAMFVEVAEKYGIKGIIHKDFEETKKKLAIEGLTL